jgi:putative nucleotidyltransferase with HDIG domain
LLGARNGSQGGSPSIEQGLYDICSANHVTILSDWLARVPAEDRARYPRLQGYLAAFLRGLCSVFAQGDWREVQAVLTDLAQRHARSGLQLENGLQRTLLLLRSAVAPHLKPEERASEELLVETLNECVLRFFESYQGVRLRSENDRFYTRVIKSLVTALEARDPYTKGHSISVALLAHRLASHLDDDPGRAYLGGLLHDVGKVGIPDSILTKAGPLTLEELEVMRTHPEMGARILKPIKLYPEVIDGVLGHHEDFDGGGYPYGLAGTDIPPLARILRVADSFDAMTSSRVFRPSSQVSVTLKELSSLAGSVYDPRVVEALEYIVEEKNEVRGLSLATLQMDLVG